MTEAKTIGYGTSTNLNWKRSFELETFERMMWKSKRLSNVTFDSCKRDGLTPGCYPYEYDINCMMPIDDSWPIGTMKPWRKYDPENEHRQLTRHQKEGTIRRWSGKK